jgi:hypothetical protein
MSLVWKRKSSEGWVWNLNWTHVEPTSRPERLSVKLNKNIGLGLNELHGKLGDAWEEANVIGRENSWVVNAGLCGLVAVTIGDIESRARRVSPITLIIFNDSPPFFPSRKGVFRVCGRSCHKTCHEEDI